MGAARFFRAGWIRFSHDPAIADWAARARPVAEACLAEPENRARWLRCGGTWFAGVKVFPNDAAGAVPQARVPELAGAPVRFIAEALALTGIEWDKAQISVCLPGYPQPSAGESEGAFRFRRDRDAAHVDGLKRLENRRRRPGEPHGFILGLPLTDAPADAAPCVVWEGSHEVMRRALRMRLDGVPPERWAAEDVTDAYVAARRECFETCRRITVHAQPGEAYLIHRLALHGVAPWRAGTAGEREIAYFRPNPFPGAAPGWWLQRP
jgi:hypothetical protein